MIERFLEPKDVVKAKTVIIDKDCPVVTTDEWLVIQQAVQAFKPFKKITNIISGEKYLSGSMLIVLINRIMAIT